MLHTQGEQTIHILRSLVEIEHDWNSGRPGDPRSPQRGIGIGGVQMNDSALFDAAGTGKGRREIELGIAMNQDGSFPVASSHQDQCAASPCSWPDRNTPEIHSGPAQGGQHGPAR